MEASVQNKKDNIIGALLDVADCVAEIAEHTHGTDIFEKMLGEIDGKYKILLTIDNEIELDKFCKYRISELYRNFDQDYNIMPQALIEVKNKLDYLNEVSELIIHWPKYGDKYDRRIHKAFSYKIDRSLPSNTIVKTDFFGYEYKGDVHTYAAVTITDPHPPEI